MTFVSMPTSTGLSAGRTACVVRPFVLSNKPPTLRACALRTRALFGRSQREAGKEAQKAMLGNLMDRLKDAQKMVKDETAKLQSELAKSEYEGFSADETVRVVVDGNQCPTAVDITEEAYKQGAERLGELIVEAAQEAHAGSINAMQSKMQTLATNLGLPPVS